MASLLRENLVQALDRAAGMSLRRSSSYKRESLDETRKSMDALLNMNFLFSSETLRDLCYQQLTFTIRKSRMCTLPSEKFES